MVNFEKYISQNEDIEFVVHTQNKEESEALIEALERLEFEYSVPLWTIRELYESFVKDDGYDMCWRISRERGVSYNPSVEHWKLFVHDIVEVQNDEIVFHEGYCSKESAEIEKNKLRKAFFEDESKDCHRKNFGLEHASDEEIENWLKTKFSKD